MSGWVTGGRGKYVILTEDKTNMVEWESHQTDRESEPQSRSGLEQPPHSIGPPTKVFVWVCSALEFRLLI